MISRTRKGEISSYSRCNASPFRASPTNGSVITLATRVRNENLGGAVTGIASKMTLEQTDDTKCVT